MLFRPLAALLPAVLCAALLAGCGRGGGEAQMHEVRMAVRSQASDPRTAQRWSTFKTVFERATGLPVKLYQSTDYNGVIQAFASNQVDVALLAADSYANVDAQIGKLADPILAVREAEGSMGYYSGVVVKADSPYRSLQDLKGHSLVYPDFNSTSGYLFPRAKMREQGFDPDKVFSKTGISGGHIQSVMAVENGQYDAAVVYLSGGTPQTGFATGPVVRLAQLGMIKSGAFRIIWTAGPIPTTALSVRADRPQSFIDAVRGAAAAMPYDDPKTWDDVGQINGSTFAAVDRSFYASIIKLRAEDIAHRRGQK
ncbi:MAG: phosphate/phosphite/phosphonate ABC transporter substrate-binding protein [Caulobacteraceae bacterium]